MEKAGKGATEAKEGTEDGGEHKEQPEKEAVPCSINDDVI